MGLKVLKSWAFLAVFGALGAASATATGNLSCTIDDANLAVTLLANTNSAHGTIVNVHNSHLTLKSRALAAAGKMFNIEPDHIIQQWFLERELRIAINIDGPQGELLLVIIGQPSRGREGYSGRYSLTVSFPHSSTWTARGQIKGCSGG
jgi:hypothetical protein